MASKLLYSAESWDKVYKAFEQVNFTAYDYDAVKQSLIDYLKLTYPENFNDYIESSQLIAILEAFAYIAEQVAYRVDMASHEGTISTAQRKQMILRHAKFLCYSAARNIPLRGLLKVTSVSCSEDMADSQGNILTNKTIRWADASNSLWREQFNLVVGRLLTRSFGAPLKIARVNDVVFQQHELRNLLEADVESSSFTNGVLPYTIDVNGRSHKFELVPADVDENGVFERSPDPTAHFNVLYSDDGYGETSPMTGFLLFTKQGVLNKLRYSFDYKLPNRSIDIDIADVNDVDVWLHEVTESGSLIQEWQQIDSVNGENLFFNQSDTAKKYEIETLEDDKIRMLFGDDDFAAIPTGSFNIWVRSSDAGDLTVPRDAVVNRGFTFAYMSSQGRRETCTLTLSLISALQNGSASEDIEHIRAVAPAVSATQGRMVNGEDYNTYPLKDSTILHLKTVNRTFAGQPTAWNDPSAAYQTVKLFGDDGRLYFDISSNSVTSRSSARSLIDNVIEPLLGTPEVYNLLSYSFFASGEPLSLAFVRPRIKLIESAAEGIFEKTMLQGVIDRHWYGEPDSLVQLGPDLTTSTSPKSFYAVVNEDADGRIYDPNRKLVTKSGATYTLATTPGNVSGIQDIVMRQRKFGIRFNPNREFASQLVIGDGDEAQGTIDLLTIGAVGASAVEEVLTLEIINDSGEFTVIGSVTGQHANGQVGEQYDNGYINVLIGFPGTATDTSLITGDAFIIKLVPSGDDLVPALYKRNLNGLFELINELSLPESPELLEYDPTDPIASWVMLVERNDDDAGNLDFWRVTSRSFRLVLGSPTTKFFFDKSSYIVDQETKQRVRDSIKMLKTNLDIAGDPLGTDQRFFVVDSIRHHDGEVNPYGLLISPDISSTTADSIERAPASFNSLKLIDVGTSYVYFKRDTVTGRLTMIDSTSYIQGLTYINGISVSGTYVRKPGRAPVDFSWTHYVGGNSLLNPATSNIHDSYILTRGYYTAMLAYLNGTADRPVEPTSFELRTAYRETLQKKMISDAVVIKPARVKLLFGDKAVPELRAKLKLVREPGSRITDDQLRTKVLSLVQEFFNIEEWGFGKTFYAQALCTVLQSKLPTDLASVVLVPELPTSSFGDMLQVTAAPDEVLMTALELKDIIIVSELNRVTLRQR